MPGEPSREQLAAFADGELEGRERELVECWLTEHPEAGAEVEAWRRLTQVWHQTAPAEPAPPAWERALARIEAALPAAASRPPASPPWRVWSAAAVAAVLAGVLLLGRPFWNGKSPPDLPVEEGLLPVARSQDVTIICMDACDTDALVVGQEPVTGPINLAEHSDIQLLERKNTDIRVDDWGTPMIVDPLAMATGPNEDD